MNLQAFAFAQIAINLFNNDLNAPPTNGEEATRFCRSGIPFVVNGVFAIELYLKTLAMIHNKTLRKEHKLLNLYGQLPQSAHMAIRKATPAFLIKHNLSPSTDLGICFGTLNNAFIEWRYLPEGKTLKLFPITETIFLIETLNEACNIELRGVA